MSITEEQKVRIADLCQRVVNAHNAHIVNGLCDLIDRSPGACPNGNQIYHLYSDGEITYQKGAWAYEKRGEHTYYHFGEPQYKADYLFYGRNTLFKFSINSCNGLTYSVLSREECVAFRDEMKEIMNIK